MEEVGRRYYVEERCVNENGERGQWGYTPESGSDDEAKTRRHFDFVRERYGKIEPAGASYYEFRLVCDITYREVLESALEAPADGEQKRCP